MPLPAAAAIAPIGFVLGGHILKLLNDAASERRAEEKRQGIEDLTKKLNENLIEGISGTSYIDFSKMPSRADWTGKFGLEDKDWYKIISAWKSDLITSGHKFGPQLAWSQSAQHYEEGYLHQYRKALEEHPSISDTPTHMSYIKEDHEPPVLLGKKAKLVGEALGSAIALGKVMAGVASGSGKPPDPPSETVAVQDEPPVDGNTKSTNAEDLNASTPFRLPREEWLFKGNMFHWTTIRFPIRKIAQIPECDIFKNVYQYGDNDNVFLLDNLTMYPFTCWLTESDNWNTSDLADLAFGCYKKWRVKRVHYKISQFRTVTSRTMAVAGQNKVVTGDDATGRILYASDQSGCVTFCPFNDTPTDISGVNTSDYIKSSIYMGGAKIRASCLGNPLFWEDVRWMNENSVVVLNYNFDDTYLGRTTWFRKLWNYTWTTDNKDKPWGKHNLWLIPGINTTGDVNRTMIWPGRNTGQEVKFFNFQNKNGPICLCIPRTGEYNQDESRPKFSASCLIEGYMDVEVAMTNWGNDFGRFGLQRTYRGDEVFLKYVPKASNGKELQFGKFDLFWNNVDPSQD